MQYQHFLCFIFLGVLNCFCILKSAEYSPAARPSATHQRSSSDDSSGQSGRLSREQSSASSFSSSSSSGSGFQAGSIPASASKESSRKPQRQDKLAPAAPAANRSQAPAAKPLSSTAHEEQKSAKNWSHFHLVCARGMAEAAQYFIEQGADINAPVLLTRTPLHLAAERGNVATVDLLAHMPQIQPNVHDELGETPLHSAIIHYCEDVVQRLLAIPGIQVNIATFAGATPLHYAAEVGSVRMVQMLLEHKANIFARTKSGLTAEQLAIKAGATPVAQLLEAARKEAACPVCLSCKELVAYGPCDHKFCAECLLQLQKKAHLECPLCRGPNSNNAATC